MLGGQVVRTISRKISIPALLTILFLMLVTQNHKDAVAQIAATPTPDPMQERRENLMKAQEADIGPPQTLAPLSALPCVDGFAGPYPCNKVDLMAFLPLSNIGGGSGNDIWGWTDPLDGKEYALMGRSSGTSFVDISDPENPIYLGNLPTHSVNSPWRDIKVYNNYAFIVSEANAHGMQVFDLTELRSVVNPPVTFAETAHYSDFGSAHNVAINEDSGYAYAVGTFTCSGGLHMVDISNPLSPTFAGCYSSDGYTHDAQCVIYNGPDIEHQGKEICFNSNENTLTIVDVTNKSNPVLLSSSSYPGVSYTHQGWLTEDHANFLLGDEGDEITYGHNTRTYLWDLIDLDAPVLTGNHTATTPAIDHNMYVKGDYVFQSNYRAGLRILDVSGIGGGILVEMGYFDIYPANDNPSFDGTWSNYPYFSSGNVIVSGIDEGLFVLQPQPASIELDKTVGTDADLCATTDNIDVPSGTEVTYCYTVTNTSDITLPLHNLIDSKLGILLEGAAYELEPGMSFSYLTATVILTDTINSAIWTAYVDELLTAEATDSATVSVVNPSIELDMTVGLDANTCAQYDSITLPEGMEVTYCYTVSNTGDITLPLHDLIDSELGILLDDFAYELLPGASTFITATAMITESTVNTATWTAFVDQLISAWVSDSASVSVDEPSIKLNVTVGTESGTCAASDSIEVPAGTDVTYCHQVTNNGAFTLTVHNLVDSELGVLLNNFTFDLSPGASTSITSSTTIISDTFSSATWTAYTEAGGVMATSSDSAAVAIMGFDSIYLPFIRRQ